MNGRVLEIFSSVQGEGKYVGARQVFVRLFECNMHCSWCDTPASIGDTARHYTEMSVEDVFARIRGLWPGSHSVSLTGGEPLMQTEFLKCLCPLLKQASMPVYLETNGIFHQELKSLIKDIDVIAMDIKMPSSTGCRDFWREHEAFLDVSLEDPAKDFFIKTVVSSSTAKEDIERTVELISGRDKDLLLILQPNTYEMKNGVIRRCMEFQEYCLKYLPNTRVLPQVHKFMRIP